jgi:hypothetical protein
MGTLRPPAVGASPELGSSARLMCLASSVIGQDGNARVITKLTNYPVGWPNVRLAEVCLRPDGLIRTETATAPGL